MKKLIFLFVLKFSVSAFSQSIDDVRLGYGINNTMNRQLYTAASNNGRFLAFLYSNKEVKIFDLFTHKFVSTFTFSTDYSNSSFNKSASTKDFIITNDGKVLILDLENNLKIYDWKKGAVLKEIRTAISTDVKCKDYDPIHNYYVIGLDNGHIVSYDINTFQLLFSKNIGWNLNSLSIYHDGDFFAVSFTEGNKKYMNYGELMAKSGVKKINIKTGEIIDTKLIGYVYSIAINSEGKMSVLNYFEFSNIATVEIYDQNFNKVKQFELKDLYNFTTEKGTLVVKHELLRDKIIFVKSDLSIFTYDINQEKLIYISKNDLTIWSKSFFIYNKLNIIKLNQTKILFSYGDNISRIYDSETNTVSAFLFTDGGGNFCVIAKDGRIDGNEDALKSVYWTSRRSKTKTPLESNFDRGYTPKLLNQLLAQTSTEPIKDFDIDSVIDKVSTLQIKSVNNQSYSASKTIETNQKIGKIEVQVASVPEEIVEIKLYQNAKLAKTISNNGSSKYSFEYSLNNSFGEENYFYIVASTKSGIETEKQKFTIQYKNSTEEQPKLYLVTIGINQYKNPKYNLNYAINDADGVDKAIKDNASMLFKEIVQYNIRNDKAIKTNIFATFDEVKGKINEQDVLLVYYAGHGVMSEGEADKKDFYIVPHDVTQLYGQTQILTEKAVSATELKEYAKQINAQKQIFILDACQSAGALETIANRGAAEEKAIAQLARSTGTFWITATGSDQFASEFDKLGHGIFTYALLEGINGKADANGDKKLTVRELSTYVENLVPELSEQLKGKAQYPAAYSFGNDYSIILYK